MTYDDVVRQAKLGLSNAAKAFLHIPTAMWALPFVPLGYIPASYNVEHINVQRAKAFAAIGELLSEANLRPSATKTGEIGSYSPQMDRGARPVMGGSGGANPGPGAFSSQDDGGEPK